MYSRRAQAESHPSRLMKLEPALPELAEAAWMAAAGIALTNLAKLGTAKGTSGLARKARSRSDDALSEHVDEGEASTTTLVAADPAAEGVVAAAVGVPSLMHSNPSLSESYFLKSVVRKSTATGDSSYERAGWKDDPAPAPEALSPPKGPPTADREQ